MDGVNLAEVCKALDSIAESISMLSISLGGAGAIGRQASSSAPGTPGGAIKKQKAPRVHSPVMISDALARFINADPTNTTTRPEVEAAIMEYVHAHELQDAADKRKIIPDDTLSQILINGSDPITVLTLKGAIKHHYSTA